PTAPVASAVLAAAAPEAASGEAPLPIGRRHGRVRRARPGEVLSARNGPGGGPTRTMCTVAPGRHGRCRSGPQSHGRGTANAADRPGQRPRMIEGAIEMTDTQETWLTQESYDRLKAELDGLIANRPVIAAEINERREEGDLKENGGYHAAREEQGQQEARIRQLQELLGNANVGVAPTKSGVALPGSVVEVYYGDDKSDTEKFLIATREEASADDEMQIYSPSSPLGGALIDAKVGETREYLVPSGKTMKVTLLSAEPYAG